MLKKKILLIAPSSIPTFGAEAIVNKKLIFTLVKSEKFEIDLISQRIKWKHYPVEEQDIPLKSIHIIDNDLRVTPIMIWQHILAFFKFGITFKAIHWAVKALPIAEKLVKQNKYDYILTKDAPSFVIGNYLKHKYGIKWIATWNDPYPGVKYPCPYGKGWSASGNVFDKMCTSAMEGADKYIFPSERLRNHMLKYLNIRLEDTVIIPHVVLDTDNNNVQQGKVLKLLHSGTLQSPRDPETFLRALKLFLLNNPDSNIEVSILGIIEEKGAKLIKQLKLEDVVKLIPPVSYTQSLEILKDYQIALIVEAQCNEGIFLPTKVTDFMQCHKPIFAVSPSVGVLNDMYNNGFVQYFADVTDIDSIANTLENIYSDFSNDKLTNVVLRPNSEFSEKQIIEQYYNL
ncbi:glycosyltransferase [Oscillospiraceae bacterium N12]|jgi:glycosyltransferase involved in cell wall biosynthesis|uniref:Glycosyltransferase n=1 Tax=Jilunia laotingensis TaxID=2763675 RepID=A0A926IPJ5_9BACT|nr:glycosyltransferase [Jilunia laotingensis]MBC8591748.1 glycosyltransferase [Jilunia laotingensis]